MPLLEQGFGAKDDRGHKILSLFDIVFVVIELAKDTCQASFLMMNLKLGELNLLLQSLAVFNC